MVAGEQSKGVGIASGPVDLSETLQRYGAAGPVQARLGAAGAVQTSGREAGRIETLGLLAADIAPVPAERHEGPQDQVPVRRVVISRSDNPRRGKRRQPARRGAKFRRLAIERQITGDHRQRGRESGDGHERGVDRLGHLAPEMNVTQMSDADRQSIGPLAPSRARARNARGRNSNSARWPSVTISPSRMHGIGRFAPARPCNAA